MVPEQSCRHKEISIHALREEGDTGTTDHTTNQQHFYPRPPRGGRPSADTHTKQKQPFLSTPSARRATPGVMFSFGKIWHFYPRPPRGGRPTALLPVQPSMTTYFYPRPPRGGRLPGVMFSFGKIWHFYPRPPRGGRPRIAGRSKKHCRFLSTPSARRATDYGCECNHRHVDFYPRPPRGGRLTGTSFAGGKEHISIHALREEGDRRA